MQMHSLFDKVKSFFVEIKLFIDMNNSMKEDFK